MNPDPNHEGFQEIVIADPHNYGNNPPTYGPAPPQHYYAQPVYPPAANVYPPAHPGGQVVYEQPQAYYPTQQAYPVILQPSNQMIVNSPQMMPPSQPPVQVIVVELVEEVDKNLVKYSRWARYAAMANGILDLLIMVGVPFLFFTIAFDLLGYFGARRFNKCMTVGYLVYLGIIVLVKFIIMGVLPYPYVIAIYLILIVLECLDAFLFVRFALLLFKTSEDQRQKLHDYHRQQGKTGFFCCFI